MQRGKGPGSRSNICKTTSKATRSRSATPWNAETTAPAIDVPGSSAQLRPALAVSMMATPPKVYLCSGPSGQAKRSNKHSAHTSLIGPSPTARDSYKKGDCMHFFRLRHLILSLMRQSCPRDVKSWSGLPLGKNNIFSWRVEMRPPWPQRVVLSLLL